MDETPPPLQPLDEDWERALCVVAHPDDLEFGAAAAVARWTGQGKHVVYCMVTSGEAGIDGMHPDECRVVREAEQVESARIVGVDEVDFLGLPDGVLEYGVRAAPRDRRASYAVTAPRSWSPATSATPGAAPTSTRPTTSPSARPSLDAVRDAGNRWVFPEQLEPTGSSRGAGSARCGPFGSPQATHGVDTTDTFDAGVASLEAHRAYIDGLGWEHFDPREFLEGFARGTGQRLGVAFAAPFEVFPMGWGG